MLEKTRNYFWLIDFLFILIKNSFNFRYKCNLCPAAFRLQADLRNHMKVHYLKEENDMQYGLTDGLPLAE